MAGSAKALHLIAEDLSDEAIPTWAAEGVTHLERLLGSYAAFEQYLKQRGSEAGR